MRLYKKEINCALALWNQGNLRGKGIVVVEIIPGVMEPVLAYLGSEDKYCTFSPGFVKRYNSYTRAEHDPFESLKVEKNNKQANLRLKTKNGIDYTIMKIHHFNSPIKSLSEVMPFQPVAAQATVESQFIVIAHSFLPGRTVTQKSYRLSI